LVLFAWRDNVFAESSMAASVAARSSATALAEMATVDVAGDVAGDAAKAGGGGDGEVVPFVVVPVSPSRLISSSCGSVGLDAPVELEVLSSSSSKSESAMSG
jgi:hypothetical protein